MVQKVRVLLIDDLDGSEAVETVTFAVDGVSYEIDLNEKNAADLREAFAPWIGHGRRAGGRKIPTRRAGGSGTTSGSVSDASKIREWARENGFQISARGRVSSEIREAYVQAH
ncbi:MAG: Lsr2 family protein [Actinomycetales bacterium]|nr:Lsr2 family protein [Actinomycetales bacterium]